MTTTAPRSASLTTYLPEPMRGGPSWLAASREAAWAVHRALPSADRANHLWRYSDPAEFELPDDAGAPASAGDSEVTIVFDAASGVEVLPLAEAAAKMPDLVTAHLGRLVPAAGGKPESLNAALWSAGYLIRIPRGVTVESPVRILTTLGAEESFRAVRNLVIAEEGAAATIVEESRGPQDGGRRSLNEVTELFAGPDSHLRYVPLQRLGRGAVSHRIFRARCDHGARLMTAIVSFGAGLYKADLGALLEGEGAESKMIGLVFGDGRQRADHHTVQDHRGAHTQSDIDFRVVLAGRARSAYTGLIRIAREAPYCEAFQENRNLLLSDACKAESIPELEILTDEVRCKHGATAGPIDPEQLFYLSSRGLSTDEATKMIITGFLEATLGNIPEELGDSIREEMRRRLGEVAAR
jgi:Fe-S cluster assembly protein SufD